MSTYRWAGAAAQRTCFFLKNSQRREIRIIPKFAVHSAKRAKNAGGGGGKEKSNTVVVTVEPDGSDLWRLDEIVDLIKGGAVRLIECLSLRIPQTNYYLID